MTLNEEKQQQLERIAHYEQLMAELAKDMEDLEELLESIPYHDQIIHSIQGMMPSGCTRVIAR